MYSFLKPLTDERFKILLKTNYTRKDLKMDENVLKKVLKYCGIKSETLVETLQLLGIDSYFAICELKNNHFIEKCENYLYKKNIDINPGTSALLKKIGLKISNLDEEEFDDQFMNIQENDEILKYPLLNELNKQLSQKIYSETLKDVSILMRLQAGRQVHQFLSDNLPLPKTSATDKYLREFDYINEGELQVNINI